MEMNKKMYILFIILTMMNNKIALCFKPNYFPLFDFFFRNPSFRCNCVCGIPNRQGRLLGGEYLSDHEFPWLVSISLRGGNASNGVLINDQYVLTAASPLIGFTPYDIKVTLGHYDLCFPDISSINISVESVFIHPDFNPGNRAHDLALLRLANIASLERRIRPICLPTPATSYLGQVATIVSWQEGETVGGQVEATCRPRKIGLPVLGSNECMRNFAQMEFLSSDKGCAGIVGGPSYVCKSDAGNPVTFRNFRGTYELIGILTDKNECRKDFSTALFTKVNDNLKWILHQTKDSCFCSKP